VLAAFRREDEAGNLDYGASERRPWLTEKGKAVLLDARSDDAGLTSRSGRIVNRSDGAA